MNSALSETAALALLPRERELLKTISKLVRKDPKTVVCLKDLVATSGIPLTSVHQILKSLVDKGWLEITAIRGMQLTLKEPA